jgi:UDP-glucose 4-epimerase
VERQHREIELGPGAVSKIVITGGAGFIGCNLVHRLAQDGGHDIVVIDNESLGRLARLDGLGITLVKGDILETDKLDGWLAGADTVFHCAADTRVMDSIENPDHNFRNNVIGTYGLLRAAQRAGVRRFLNASTGGAILGEVPAPVHEEIAPRPLSPYGASKLAAEGYCSAFDGAYGLKTASLRFSNIYGPLSFHKGSVVAHFFKRILKGEELVVYGDGSQIRDYLFVGDLIEGLVRAMNSDATGVFQLGSGRPVRLDALIEAMRGVVGAGRRIDVRYEDFRAGEIRETWCAIDKARAAFGFDPKTPLADGLAATWRWFEETAA